MSPFPRVALSGIKAHKNRRGAETPRKKDFLRVSAVIQKIYFSANCMVRPLPEPVMVPTLTAFTAITGRSRFA